MARIIYSLLFNLFLISYCVNGRVVTTNIPISAQDDGSLVITTVQPSTDIPTTQLYDDEGKTTSVDLQATPGDDLLLLKSKPVKAAIDGALKPEIRSFRIQSNIRYRYSRTHVTSRVANPSKDASQEVTFTVVLPETAFISKFIMDIDGKPYEAYVKPKDEAKNIYNQAQSQGQSAGLVELNTRNSNIFNVNVNIKAQSKVNFNLTYEELLSRRLGRYEQSLSITPEQVKNVQDFEVVVNIEESQNITLLRVPELRNDIEEGGNPEGNMKDAQIERNGTKAKVTWKPASKDLSSLSEQGITGKFIVQYDIERELNAGQVLVMNGYFVHFFAPTNLPPLRKHVIFVLDISGSMWGRKMEQLKEAMTKILADLNSDDYLNIITFSSDVNLWGPSDKIQQDPTNSWSPPAYLGEKSAANIANGASKKQPFPASAENIKKAQSFIDSLVATGGTNIYDAVTSALNLTSHIRQASAKNASAVSLTPEPTNSTDVNATEASPLNVLPKGVESLIIFLTDGEPTVGVTNPTTIQSLIQAANKNLSVPLFSLAFGEGADFPFVRKLSLQNNGFARKIYEASDATLQLTGFYNEIASPLLSNVTFNYTSPDYQVTNLTIAKFPTIFGGTEIAIAGVLVPTNATDNSTAPTVNNDDVFDEETTGSPRLEDSIALPAEDVPPEPLVRTDVYDLIVKVGGMGRDGSLEFSDPEIFSCVIPWGVPPVVKPFPPRPTPPPTPEDTFLEKLWAYLTIRQLIDQDLAAIEKDNEIDNDVDSGDIGTSSTTAASVPTNKTVKETPKKRALKLALKYGFVTPLTSLVVVKPNDTQVTNAVPTDAKPDTQDSISSPQAMAQYLLRPPVKKFSGNRVGVAASLPLSFQAHRPVYAQPIPVGFIHSWASPGGAFQPLSSLGPSGGAFIASAFGGPPPPPQIFSKFGVSGGSGGPIHPSTPRPIFATVAPSFAAPESLSTPLNVATTSVPVSTTEAAPVTENIASTASPSLALKDIRWFSESAREIRLNGTNVYKIAVNETDADLTSFSTGVPCEIAPSQQNGTCVHLKDCVQTEFVDNYELFKQSYLCGIESTESNQVPYAGVCCPLKEKKEEN